MITWIQPESVRRIRAVRPMVISIGRHPSQVLLRFWDAEWRESVGDLHCPGPPNFCPRCNIPVIDEGNGRVEVYDSLGSFRSTFNY